MIVSFNALPKRIASGSVFSATDAQLATLATACTQHRESRSHNPSTPPRNPPPACPRHAMMTFK